MNEIRQAMFDPSDERIDATLVSLTWGDALNSKDPERVAPALNPGGTGRFLNGGHESRTNTASGSSPPLLRRGDLSGTRSRASAGSVRRRMRCPSCVVRATCCCRRPSSIAHRFALHASRRRRRHHDDGSDHRWMNRAVVGPVSRRAPLRLAQRAGRKSAGVDRIVVEHQVVSHGV